MLLECLEARPRDTSPHNPLFPGPPFERPDLGGVACTSSSPNGDQIHVLSSCAQMPDRTAPFTLCSPAGGKGQRGRLHNEERKIGEERGHQRRTNKVHRHTWLAARVRMNLQTSLSHSR